MKIVCRGTGVIRGVLIKGFKKCHYCSKLQSFTCCLFWVGAWENCIWMQHARSHCLLVRYHISILLEVLVTSESHYNYNWYKFQTPCGSFHPAIGKRSKDASSTRGRWDSSQQSRCPAQGAHACSLQRFSMNKILQDEMRPARWRQRDVRLCMSSEQNKNKYEQNKQTQK